MHSQYAGISGIFCEPDSDNAAAMRFSCEPHGQNAGIVGICNNAKTKTCTVRKLGFPGVFVNQTVKLLELLRLFVNHMVKMLDFSRRARSKCWRF